MTVETPTSSVQTSIVVNAPIERAFTIFTEQMGSWWPPDMHILEAPLAEMVFEPREGGRIYDVGTDGSECQWSRVLAYEPPTRVVISWDINLQWQIETDPARTSEVEIRFSGEDDNRTRVDLEHRNLDRHGDGWEGMRNAVGSPGGWRKGLAAFTEAIAAQPSPESS
jgi:uncharacterized protein YndB with AHSA1/START domain